MTETPSRFRFSTLGYFAMLTAATGLFLFLASLFLPVNSGGDTGWFALFLGVFGSLGAVPSDQPELWVYSVLGTLLNLTLCVVSAKWFFAPHSGTPRSRGICGSFLLFGYLVFTLHPVSFHDGVAYRVWVSGFLLGGLGMLLSAYDKRQRNSPPAKTAK